MFYFTCSLDKIIKTYYFIICQIFYTPAVVLSRKIELLFKNRLQFAIPFKLKRILKQTLTFFVWNNYPRAMNMRK